MRPLVLQVSDSHVFGGAERVILQLLERLDNRWDQALLHPALANTSPLLEGAQSLGVRCFEADFPAGMRELPLLPELVRQIARIRPSVVHVHLATALRSRFA